MSKELVLGLLVWGLLVRGLRQLVRGLWRLVQGLVRGLCLGLRGLRRLALHVLLLVQALELLLLELGQLVLLELVLLELVQLLQGMLLLQGLQGLLGPVQRLLGEGQRLWGEGVRRRLGIRLLGDLWLRLELQELLGRKVQHRGRRWWRRRRRRGLWRLLWHMWLGSHLHLAEQHCVGICVALLAVIHLLL